MCCASAPGTSSAIVATTWRGRSVCSSAQSATAPRLRSQPSRAARRTSSSGGRPAPARRSSRNEPRRFCSTSSRASSTATSVSEATAARCRYSDASAVGGGRALEQQDAADRLVARGDRNLDRPGRAADASGGRRRSRRRSAAARAAAPTQACPAARSPQRRAAERRSRPCRRPPRRRARRRAPGRRRPGPHRPSADAALSVVRRGWPLWRRRPPQPPSGLPREYASRPGGRWRRLARTQGGRCASGTSTPEDAAGTAGEARGR